MAQNLPGPDPMSNTWVDGLSIALKAMYVKKVL
jgi:hypothetical protein